MANVFTALEALSSWPLLLEAAPDKLLDIRFTVDGEVIEQITCARLAVVSVQHDQGEMFMRDPWKDRLDLGIQQERARIIEVLRTLQVIPGWDGTFSGLLPAVADLLQQGHL